MKRMIAGRPLNPVGLGCMNLSWAYGAPPPEAEAVPAAEPGAGCGIQSSRHCQYLWPRQERGTDCPGRGPPARRILARQQDGDCGGRAEPRGGLFAGCDQRLPRCQPATARHRSYRPLLHAPLRSQGAGGRQCRRDGPRDRGGQDRCLWRVRMVLCPYPRSAWRCIEVGAVQTEYSLWTRNVELGVLATCRELGIPLVGFSPVGRGALGGSLRDPATLEDADLRTRMPRFSAENWPHNLALIQQFEQLARDHGLAPAQLALGWVLAQGDHCHVIPGTTSIAHLEENLAAASLAIPQAVVDEAGRIINHATIAGHRYHQAIRPTIDTEDFAEG